MEIATWLRAAWSRSGQPAGLGFQRLWTVLTSPAVTLGPRVRIRKGASFRATDGGSIRIAAECEISRDVLLVAQAARIDLGANTFVGPWTIISAKDGVHIGRECLIAERVTIRDQDHDIHGDLAVPIARSGFNTAQIQIGDGAWIGAGAVVLRGVRIGSGAVIAANAVVIRDVADLEIVGGVPAVRIGTRDRSS